MIKLGAANSTLSKLQAISVGESLKEKIPEIQIEYLFSTENPVDASVHKFQEKHNSIAKPNKIFSVLPRGDQRYLLLFKKEILSKTLDHISILTSKRKGQNHIAKFLSEYLPLNLRNKEIVFEDLSGDLVDQLKTFLNSNANGIILTKACIDRMLSPVLVKEWKEEFTHTKDFIRDAINQCLFLIPPLSLCPNDPGEGTLVVALHTDNDRILNSFRLLHDHETETTANAEKLIETSLSDRDDDLCISHLIRNYGTIEYIKGKNQNISQIKEGYKAKFSISEIWPPNGKMAARQRERLDYKIPFNSDLFVSRGYAYPLDLNVNPENQIVWTAGLSTWKDLSNRNIWVHGTSDGLGESEPTRLSNLMGRKLNFVKLSHMDSDTTFSTYPLISTYRVSSPEIPTDFDPKKIKAAFWRSSTEFETITNRFPELKNVIHFTSPGSTYSKIKKELGHKPNFQIYTALSFEDWRRENLTK
jgi:hydroxymethylbilane synthase